MPAAMGSQIRIDRDSVHSIDRRSAKTAQEPAQQHRQANDHPECVGVQIAALHLPQHAAEPAYGARRAVDQRAIDQRLIAALPQTEADAARERAR